MQSSGLLFKRVANPAEACTSYSHPPAHEQLNASELEAIVKGFMRVLLDIAYCVSTEESYANERLGYYSVEVVGTPVSHIAVTSVYETMFTESAATPKNDASAE